MPENTSNLVSTRMQINNILQRLRNKLNSFAVVNLQGEVLGRVRDFFIDNNRHLHMVVSSDLTKSRYPRLLLSRKYIQTVDPVKKEVIVDLSKMELEALTEYKKAEEQATKISNKSVQQLVNNRNNISSEQGWDMEENQIAEAENSAESELVEQSDHDGEPPEVVEEEIIRLLEEKLVVNRSKHKVGEVVIRKEIETRMVEVPVRREKLIVEQVGSETKQLAEIDLGGEEIIGVDPRSVSNSDTGYTVTGEFVSPKAASDLLEAIALQNRHGCTQVRVEVVVDNPQLQETYQRMFDRCSKR